MRRVDIWSTSRNEAVSDETTGLKILRRKAGEKPWVQIWKPKAIRPFVNYTFKNSEQMEAHIAQVIESQKSHAKLIEERRAERSQPHSFKVGDIVYNSWGYDQTNIDFYQIIKTSSSFVWIRELRNQTTETGFMCGQTVPVLGAFASEKIEQRKADSRGYVGFKHGCCSAWDGQPKYSSWYS